MVCKKERVKFQAVAIFGFAYSKTEMAAAFLYIMKKIASGRIVSHYGLFYFRFPLLFFADL